MPRRTPIYHNDRIEILLTCGQSAIVDLTCPAWILDCDWHVQKRTCSTTVHAARTYRVNGKGRVAYLHRDIMGLEHGNPLHVDHIDGNGLNCLMQNMRVCTHRQNQANKSAVRGSSSRHKGVYWNKATRSWRARVTQIVNGKPIARCLGLFTNEDDAAKAYDRAALQTFDPVFVRLNFPELREQYHTELSGQV